jgi:hypothetical protein
MRLLVSQQSQAERQLLRALLHAPDAVAPARDQVHLEDFRDPVCAAIAHWMWEGGGDWPADDAAAELARELAADDRSIDWTEEARGAVRVLVVRRLNAERKERELRLGRTHSQEEERVLLSEIKQIAQSIKDWSVST